MQDQIVLLVLLNDSITGLTSTKIEMLSKEKTLVRRFYEETINGARFDKLDKYLARK